MGGCHVACGHSEQGQTHVFTEGNDVYIPHASGLYRVKTGGKLPPVMVT